MKIGKSTRISKGFYVDRPEGISFGDNCFVNHFVHLHNGADPKSIISFGNNDYIGPEVTFFAHLMRLAMKGKEQVPTYMNLL